MNNRNRKQILLKILRKSNNIMDDLVTLTMQISTQQSLNRSSEENYLFASQDAELDTGNNIYYRKILIEQLNESNRRNLSVN